MGAWERQPYESDPAWEAFRSYRDMGPGARSLSKVGRSLGKSTTLMSEWSARHNWLQRVAEFDAYLDAARVSEQVQAVRDMARQHAQASDWMLGVFFKRIQPLLHEDGDGAADLRRLPVAALPRWLDVAVRVGRLSRGAPTELLDVQAEVEVGPQRTLGELFQVPDGVSELHVARALVDRARPDLRVVGDERPAAGPPGPPTPAAEDPPGPAASPPGPPEPPPLHVQHVRRNGHHRRGGR
jgi:hypothetical protein